MLQDSIHSPFSTDIPNAFVYNNTKTSQTFYCGPNIISVQTFAEAFHYQLQLDHVESLPKKSVIQKQIATGNYNMSLHGVLIRSMDEEPFSNETDYSYPLELIKNCVMVPLAPELPKWMYMVYPLGRYVWTYLFLSIFYVAFLLRYVHLRETITRSYTRNMLHAMGILMYSPNMNMQVQLTQASMRVLVFYTLLYVQGFILSVYHISNMTAFDMKPVFVKPIDTWSDLIDSKLHIIIPDAWLDELRYQSVVDISSLNSQFAPRIWKDYQILLANPSRSFAYVVNQDSWEFFNRQQKVLIQPYFHMSEVCFGGMLNAFPMQKDAHFVDALDRFMLYVREAGLWDYWEDMAFLYAVQANYAHVFLDTYPVEPLDLEFFIIAWTVLIFGLPISMLAHVLEHLWCRRRALGGQNIIEI